MRAKSEAIKKDLDEGLKALLDHVAVELAEEYVRLMEHAAQNELAPATTSTSIAEGGNSQ